MTLLAFRFLDFVPVRPLMIPSNPNKPVEAFSPSLVKEVSMARPCGTQ